MEQSLAAIVHNVKIVMENEAANYPRQMGADVDRVKLSHLKNRAQQQDVLVKGESKPA